MISAHLQDHFEDMMFMLLDQLTFSAAAINKQHEDTDAAVSCIRDAADLWQEVVGLIKAAKPEQDINAAMLPEYLSHVSPKDFALAMEHGVFPDYAAPAPYPRSVSVSTYPLEEMRLRYHFQHRERMGLPT